MATTICPAVTVLPPSAPLPSAARSGRVISRRAATAWLLAALASPGPFGRAAAQPAPDQRRRIALVIGNQTYRFVGSLRTTRNDALGMAGALRDCDFEVVEGYDLERSEMNTKFAEFESKLSSGVIAVVYFAGHGVQVNGSNVLLPIDIQATMANSVIDNGILLSGLMDRASAINEPARGGFNLFIVDACRDNPFQGQGRSIGESRGLRTSGAAGTMVLYAAGTNQRALDTDGTGQHGLFTSVLLKEMATPGIDVRALILAVRQEVSRLAQLEGVVQIPTLYDEATAAAFAFRPGDPASIGSRTVPPILTGVVSSGTEPLAAPRTGAGTATNVGWLGANVGSTAIQRGITLAHPIGVVVNATDSGGPAALAGIRKGDTILKFQGIPVNDAPGMEKLVEANRSERQVSVRILRDGAEITAQVANPLPATGPVRHPAPRRHPSSHHSEGVSENW